MQVIQWSVYFVVQWVVLIAAGWALFGWVCR